jgi:exo-1,4-beta-D-glucosaminidase
MKTRLIGLTLMCLGVAAPARAQIAGLSRGGTWVIQSSAKVAETGQAISRAGFRTAGWYPAPQPSTVLAALVANKVYLDPLVGMNLRSIPGTSYPIGRNFSALAMPDDSPFRVAWWFRAEFRMALPDARHRVSLRFDGINYRANVWLNGTQIGRADDVAGTFRVFEFDVTDTIDWRGTNAVAVEVFPPQPDDLAWTWVDWNPAPPDKNMGLWRGVSVTTSGDVTVRHPHVASTVDVSRTRADLTVLAEVRNLSDRPVQGTLRGTIELIRFSQPVALGPRETKTVRFTPDTVPALRIVNPRLWWPAELGRPNLHRLDLEFAIGPIRSDVQHASFGIREITSELTDKGVRLFKINGRPLLIRGGGWAPDMLLRSTPERQEAEMRYVRDMGLNTIRLEGKLEDESFFDLADRYGVLVLAGWCCCDQWEQWAKWKPENRDIAMASQHDQICRLRLHPSVLAWMNGSDNPPPADIERGYVDILKTLEWPNPYVSSATAKKTEVTGESGVKMNGPYDWVPPSYWLLDSSHGGARGFATEISPGAAVPPIESLRKMLPADHLWPIDDVWNFHAGGGQFKTIQTFTTALEARYGAATGLDDYATKAQLMTYEGQRAMFEGYTRNKYTSTGVIQWMLNNAWPSLIWHLYDYYLQPGGGYFGTKKACEPVHVQYSYDDRSIVVVNGTDRRLTGARVTARLLNLDLAEKSSQTQTVDLPADSTTRTIVLPEPADLSRTHFVDLRLRAATGETLSSNFYWLSTKMDDLDLPKSTWYGTPVKAFADFTALRDLPPATVTTSVRWTAGGAAGGNETAHVTVSNPGKTLAFFVRLQMLKSVGGEEILPVLWQDNYISLMPGETRELTATYPTRGAGAARPVLRVSGWNVSK